MGDSVAELRALERRDAELSADGERLRALAVEVAALRTRAEEIDAFFAAYPEAESRLSASVAGAEAQLDERRRELTEAERAVAEARDDQAREAARRLVDRAHDHVSVAEARRARAAALRDELEREAAVLPDELPALGARAGGLTERLPDVGTPASAPRALIEWAGRARAALFVAAGQIDAERERLVREANELATVTLGEPTYGSTPSQARERVERAGGSRPRETGSRGAVH